MHLLSNYLNEKKSALDFDQLMDSLNEIGADETLIQQVQQHFNPDNLDNNSLLEPVLMQLPSADSVRCLTPHEAGVLSADAQTFLMTLMHKGAMSRAAQEVILINAMEADSDSIELDHMKNIIYHVLSKNCPSKDKIWLESLLFPEQFNEQRH